MTPEHKKYILENIHKKSAQKLARELNIKERKVRKFLEQHKHHKGPILPDKDKTAVVSKKILVLSILLIIALGFIVYGNSLNGAFIWDDDYLVKNNIYIKNWSHLPAIFTSTI